MSTNMKFKEVPIAFDGRVVLDIVAIPDDDTLLQVVPLKPGPLPPMVALNAPRSIHYVEENEATPFLVITSRGELYEVAPMRYTATARKLCGRTMPDCVPVYERACETRNMGLVPGRAWVVKPLEYRIDYVDDNHVSVTNISNMSFSAAMGTAGTPWSEFVTITPQGQAQFEFPLTAIHHMLYTGTAFNSAVLTRKNSWLMVHNRSLCGISQCNRSRLLPECSNTLPGRVASVGIDGFTFSFGRETGLLVSCMVNQEAYAWNGRYANETANLQLTQQPTPMVPNAANDMAIEAWLKIGTTVYRIVACIMQFRGQDYPMVFAMSY